MGEGPASRSAYARPMPTLLGDHRIAPALLVLSSLALSCGTTSPTGLTQQDASRGEPDATMHPADAGATPSPDAAPGGEDARVSTMPDAMPMEQNGETIMLEIEPFSVAPGTERQVCKIINLPAHANFDVVHMESMMVGTSHHFNAYKVLGQSAPVSPRDTVVHDCAPAAEQLTGNAAYIFGASRPERTVDMPPAVAFRLQAEQQIILEQHVINATRQPIMGGVTFKMTAAAPNSRIDHLADIVWMGYWAIYLPAHQRISASGNCRFPYGMTIFGLNSHTHGLGVDFRIKNHQGVEVYDSQDWAHPLYKTFDPGFTVPGGGTMQWTCTWNNTNARAVTAGRNSTDEMCIAFAYGYPTDGLSAPPFQCNVPFNPGG